MCRSLSFEGRTRAGTGSTGGSKLLCGWRGADCGGINVKGRGVAYVAGWTSQLVTPVCTCQGLARPYVLAMNPTEPWTSGRFIVPRRRITQFHSQSTDNKSLITVTCSAIPRQDRFIDSQVLSPCRPLPLVSSTPLCLVLHGPTSTTYRPRFAPFGNLFSSPNATTAEYHPLLAP